MKGCNRTGKKKINTNQCSIGMRQKNKERILLKTSELKSNNWGKTD